MINILGKQLVITFSEPFESGGRSKQVVGTALKVVRCSTGRLLALVGDESVFLIAPRYLENKLEEIGEEPLPIHIAAFKKNEAALSDTIADNDIQNVGGGTVRFLQDADKNQHGAQLQ